MIIPISDSNCTDMSPGGVSSNLKALEANLSLSSAVALTGIATPIGVSFVLLGLLPLSPVQAFAAGAALCSTSLGTTFTVLSTSGLTESRLGVVLTSAAMMDDIVGLIMVQIISTLGGGSSFDAVTVIRPVFVSIAFAVVVPLICVFVAKPLTLAANDYLQQEKSTKFRAIFCSSEAALAYHTGVLLAMITGATYAGTSNLFAAYLAGTAVTWLGDCIASHKQERISATDRTASQMIAPRQRASHQGSISATANVVDNAEASTPAEHTDDCSAQRIYERYYSPVIESFLRPLFFASIGFAIPITKMFTGPVIWRGLVYTILMILAKLICGLWLVRFATMPRGKAVANALPSIHVFTFRLLGTATTRAEKADRGEKTQSNNIPLSRLRATGTPQSSNSIRDSIAVEPDQRVSDGSSPAPNARVAANTTRKRAALPKPKSLYPAAILGSAMVARGEIGFLISSVAEANGVFGEGGNTEEFLIVTWAILLCTLIGPITVGLLVKRVKRLQQDERRKSVGREDPLGIWGILPASSTS